MQQLTFTVGLRTVCSQLPFTKGPKDDEIKFLWMLLPSPVVKEVTDEMWAYACQQRLLDPAPDDKLPVFQQILRHLYRLRDGHPEFAWGLREDLPERMAHACSFLSLAPTVAQLEPAPLPMTVVETPQARRARLLALAESLGMDLSNPSASPSPEKILD